MISLQFDESMNLPINLMNLWIYRWGLTQKERNKNRNNGNEYMDSASAAMSDLEKPTNRSNPWPICETISLSTCQKQFISAIQFVSSTDFHGVGMSFSYQFGHVWMGNPHYLFFIDERERWIALTSTRAERTLCSKTLMLVVGANTQECKRERERENLGRQ